MGPSWPGPLKLYEVIHIANKYSDEVLSLSS